MVKLENTPPQKKRLWLFRRHCGAHYLAPPPLLLIFTIALGYLANWVWPLSGFEGAIATVAIGAGIGLAIVAMLLGIICLVMFWRHKTSFHPGGETRYVVKAGPYRFSRNPMYLSLLLVQIALFLFSGITWFALTLPLLYLLILFGVILPEEKYLAEKFGETYLSYKSRVRRWI